MGHSVDVASVAEQLLALPLWRARLSALAGRDLIDIDAARLACFALWHDIGKAQVGFQSRKFEEGEAKRIRKAAGLGPFDVGHTRVVAALFARDELREEFSRVFPLGSVSSWGAAWGDLFWAAVSHHGSPLAWMGRAELDIRGADQCAAAFKQTNALGEAYDPMAEIAALGNTARLLFPAAFVERAAPLPNTPGFVHAFAGLMSLADWIASNCDAGFFPYAGASDGRSGEGPRQRYDFASKQAKVVLRSMRLDPSDARDRLRSRRFAFGDVFRGKTGEGFAPTSIQAAMSDQTLGQVVAVESETGSGKTEAAFWRFSTLFAAGQVDGMAFLMPTRVSATALMGRMETFLKDLFGVGVGEKAPLNAVLGVPGYVRADGETTEGMLADFRHKWPDANGDDPEKDCRRWAAESSKRYFAAAALVGTVDQALMAVLRVKHAHMRSAALMRSLLVVDEVHASDTYMTYLLKEVLARQVAAGGHALLLSATLAGEVRRSLLAAGQPTTRQSIGSPSIDAPVDHASMPYPAVSDASGVRYAPASTRSRRIRVEQRDMLDDAGAVARCALDAARMGARVLVIRNTVAGARAVFDGLQAIATPKDREQYLFRANGVPTLHHGRYAAEDRGVLDRAVEDYLGKQSDLGGCVVVGTQTLEISLDIDADLLITDLCPMDVLLQRLGRLHRHASRARPAGFEAARVMLLAPSAGIAPYLTPQRGRSSHGFGTVYTNMPALEAARLDLIGEEDVSVPEDCRRLVEGAIDRESLRARCACWGGGWPKAWNDASGEALAAAGEAHYAKFCFNTAWVEQDAFANATEERFRTRLGGDDFIVELPKPWRSPFGSELTRLKIPGWMGKGLTDAVRDAPVEIVRAEQREQLVFRWCGHNFKYDAMGLARAEGIPGEESE
jgi:CRISPR-associated endonuclease/helicase Cas3